MRNLFSFFVFVIVFVVPASAQQQMQSPDGKLCVNFDLRNGKPFYNVSYEGIQALDDSPLGIKTSWGDFTSGMTMGKTQTAQIQDSYTLDRSKVSQVNYNANEYRIQILNSRKQEVVINFRISNNDIAFRYEMPRWKVQGDKRFSVRVMKEDTGFDLPHGTTTFLSPQSDAMIGWKGTKPSYEEEYLFDQPMETPSQYGHGYTFPCLFRVPSGSAQGENPLWVLISETGTDSRYCGCRLSDMKGDGLYTIEFPMAEENNGNGTVEPAMALPAQTPWRTITVGNSLKPIVETTAPWDNVRPRYNSNNRYVYGKGTWSWIVWQDNSICWDDQVRYIQLARDMGYQYVLIDNWWDNNIGRQKMEQLVRYSQSQGVDVFLWYSSSGWWNDIEQGPINIMDNPITRKEYMRWMHSIGVKGIKVDFFGGDKQETLRLYEHILSDADDNGLMVIFHGCTLPRGWERMYPNYVGSEAVLASENIYFQQHFCDVEAQNTALHPFLRNTVGSMEFGGCFMNRHINRGNQGGNTRRTTDCHELATTVLFQNPIQNFAITPENLSQDPTTIVTDYNAQGAPAPQICMDFLKTVPTTWDETRFIDGYPGKYCILARRHGDRWYIAGNNATGSLLTVTLTLDMFQKGTTLSVYTDNIKTREPQQKSVHYNGKTLKITMADQGGFVMVSASL